MSDKPKLFSVYFDGGGPNSPFYVRMAKVLDFTAHQHCPGWEIEILRTGGTEAYSNQHTHSHISNTHKLDHWNRFVQEAQDGDRILLMDSDMMIIRELDDIWDFRFDIAYTTKRHKLPFNGGVMFLRVSKAVKTFMQEYWNKNMELLSAPQIHAKWRSKFGGMNQAAFGALLPEIEKRFGLNLIGIPCCEWNSEQSSWPTFDPKVARIVHIKSGLRKAIFGRGPIEAHLTPMIDIWRALEKQAAESPVMAAQ